IAVAWDRRHLGYPDERAHPFEAEVEALVGAEGGAAAAQVAAAEARVAAATAARAPASPFGALVAEFGLSQLAVDVLAIIAAPLPRGGLARLSGFLANDPGRPLCDELLVATILGAEGAARRAVARELDPDRPLVRHGLVVVAAGRARPFAALAPDPVVLARLAGAPSPMAPVASVRRADRALGELVMPAPLRRQLVADLARPPNRGPLRLVV